MKIKHIWTVLCKESIINQDDNLITLNSVIEELNIELSLVEGEKEGKAPKIPEKFTLPINMEIVSMWLRDELAEGQIDREVEYVFIDPKGNSLASSTVPFILPADKKRCRTRLKIQGVGFTVAGRYLFKVGYREKGAKILVPVSEISLDVTIKVKEPTTPKS